MDLLEVSLLIRLSGDTKFPLTDEKIWCNTGISYEIDLNFDLEQCQVIKDVFEQHDAPMEKYDDVTDNQSDILDALYVSNDFLTTIRNIQHKYINQPFVLPESFAKSVGNGYTYNVKVAFFNDEYNTEYIDDKQYKLYAENWDDFINNFKIFTIGKDIGYDDLIIFREVKIKDNNLFVICGYNY